MIIKHFKLSQPEKERLIRIKAKTGIQTWNVICRWALCWSLAEPSVPGGVDPLSDSNVEKEAKKNFDANLRFAYYLFLSWFRPKTRNYISRV